MKSRRTFLKNTIVGSALVGLSPLKGLGKGMDKEEVVNCEPTTLDFYGQGPFYTENPPLIEDNLLADPDEPGQRMVISGRILNLECNQYIFNALVDVWHANDEGQYDNDGYSLRGFTRTNNQGFYLFETIKPGKYLNGSKFRPSHIHFRITPPGYEMLITQLYFQGDTSIDEDPAASITSGPYDASDRIIELVEDADRTLNGTFDVVIDGEGLPVSTKDLHLERGMIYSASPNPFTDTVEIKYGIFKKAKVGLVVYDLQGQTVAILEDRILSPDKYISEWNPDINLPKGHYFVALRINDFQVHYLRVVKY